VKWQEADKNLKKELWKTLTRFWLIAIGILVLCTVSIATFAYLVDYNKNLPMMVKFSFLSMTSKFENYTADALREYRENSKDHFKHPEVKVWPYYICFGFANTCVILTIFSHCLPRPYVQEIRAPGPWRAPPRQQRRRQRRGRTHGDSTCDGCCNGPTCNGFCNGIDACNGDCFCCCPDSCGGSRTDCNCCGGCGDCGDGDCKGDVGGIVIIVVVLVVLVAALYGLFYLFFLGLGHTFTLQNQYAQKQLDLQRCRTEAVTVADLELGSPEKPGYIGAGSSTMV